MKNNKLLVALILVIIILGGALLVMKTNGLFDKKESGKIEIPTLNPAPSDTKGLLAIVYYDPEKGAVCTIDEYNKNLSNYKSENNTDVPTEQKNGCMKWYAYNETSTTYTMILDHNTTAGVAYNSSNANATCNEACTQLTSDTQTWKVNARMITADEIANITGNTSWNSSTSIDYFYFDSNSTTQTATTQGASKYSWLFDYTNNCTSYGCNVADSSTSGYWTSTPCAGAFTRVWTVRYYGYLYSNNALITNYGLRPVITISK